MLGDCRVAGGSSQCPKETNTASQAKQSPGSKHFRKHPWLGSLPDPASLLDPAFADIIDVCGDDGLSPGIGLSVLGMVQVGSAVK